MNRTFLHPRRATWLASMLVLVGLTAPAFAQDGDGSDEDAVDQTVSGKIVSMPVKARLKTKVGPAPTLMTQERLEAYKARPHAPQVYIGAEVLNMEVEFVAACRGAIEFIYRRDYKAAKSKFDKINTQYPGSGVGAVGWVLIWQAMMLENFDFKYESQYQSSYKKARQELEGALQVRGNDAWENFLLGGILGVDSIHTMRRGEYVTALSRGIEAMKSIQRAKELAPDFKDALMGDGLYNYWRTVITMNTKGLPDFGDHRSEGIEQMKLVEREAIFIGPPATLALTYTWLEEGSLKRALASASRNRRRYPNSVINGLLIGRIYMYLRKYEVSERSLMKVLQVAPENERVHYYLGRLYIRSKRLDDAERHLEKYLSFNLQPQYEALATYYKGLVYYKRKDYDTAEKYFKTAWKMGKLKRAKKRLERIRKIRSGEIKPK